MTAVTGSSSFVFNESMYSNPDMRSHLKAYYDSKYDAVREGLAARKEAEANGEFPTTIQTQDGKTLTAISAEKMEQAIPSFDKWLEMQQNIVSPFDFAERAESSLERAQQHLDHMQSSLHPDQPSNVRTVFSNGSQILGYINEDGGLVTHEGGGALRRTARQAEQQNLTGEEKIAYIQEHGSAELSTLYADFEMTEYDAETTPTRREFSEQWYPHHDVGQAYASQLEAAQNELVQQQALYEQHMKNLNEMRAFLLQVMEESQSGQSGSDTDTEQAATGADQIATQSAVAQAEKPLEEYAAYPDWMGDYIPAVNQLRDLESGKIGAAAQDQAYRNQHDEALDEYGGKLRAYWTETTAAHGGDIHSADVKQDFEAKVQNDSRMVELMDTLGVGTDVNAEAGAVSDTGDANDTMQQAKINAVEEFLEFMEMSPEERYIAQALAAKGYTQEEFEALPPEEQEELLDEIRAAYREEIKDKAQSGQVGETRAANAAADGQTQAAKTSHLSFDAVAAKYDSTPDGQAARDEDEQRTGAAA